uniref:Large ribosomal subunit protein bL20c n=1 Tax=Pyramimonas parkeae TaxID=36894 RepID=A0A1R7T0U2_9CHLO|nr:ribosomal protein L20 [Pyramimonas parkeae]
MTRVKRGAVARNRRRRILKLTKGFQGSHSTLFRTANQQAMKALKYSYVDRRKRKIAFRQLWIRRINASSRMYGLNYSQLIYGLKKAKIDLNRKVLAQLAILDPDSFKKIIELAISKKV